MEKKLYELNIDEEFRAMKAPLSESELSLLEENIQKYGCNTPISVWNGTIIDGHSRYYICIENSIPFSIKEMDFGTRTEAIVWIITEQLGRRNMPPFSRCELVLKYEPEISLQAEIRRREAISHFRRTGERMDKCGKDRVKTRSTLADMADVSSEQLRKAKFIVESGDEETKRRLRKGEISIHFAYTAIKEQSSSCSCSEECTVDSSPTVMTIEADKRPEIQTKAETGMYLSKDAIDALKDELRLLANGVLWGELDKDGMMKSISAIASIVKGDRYGKEAV